MDKRLLFRAALRLLIGRFDDAAALCAAALGAGAYAESAARLRAMPDPFPMLDLPTLRHCPRGSFGHACAVFMDVNGRHPLRLSPGLMQELQLRHRLPVRTLLLRDALHVLLEFDRTPAGRLGVLAFVGAQHDGPACEQAARLARRFYRLLAPLQSARLRRCEFRGRRLAERVPSPVLQALEARWDEPLERVQASLGLPSAVIGVARLESRASGLGS